MDSETAVLLLQSKVLNACHPNAGLERIKLQHIYGERNDVADGLATWSHNLDLGCCYLKESPAWPGYLLLKSTSSSENVAMARGGWADTIHCHFRQLP
ncbi:unnamed protein product [Prunus armeniaca]